jgi:hypothetical protein
MPDVACNAKQQQQDTFVMTNSLTPVAASAICPGVACCRDLGFLRKRL